MRWLLLALTILALGVPPASMAREMSCCPQNMAGMSADHGMAMASAGAPHRGHPMKQAPSDQQCLMALACGLALAAADAPTGFVTIRYGALIPAARFARAGETSISIKPGLRPPIV